MIHTALIFMSLALAIVGGLLSSYLLHPRFGHARSWNNRRTIQVGAMLLPIAILGFVSVMMAHFLLTLCFWAAPPLDVTLALGLSLAGSIALAGAMILNSARAVLLPMQLRQCTWEAPTWLRDCAARLAAEAGLPQAPRVRVVASERPWALVAGLFRPHLVVSSGLVSLLDREELEAALCHELIHIKRGDLWWTALAGVAHDLTWFLPTTRRMYRSLLSEQEMACDDHVLGEQRRLALASALVRVWQAGAGRVPAPHGALALLDDYQPSNLEARTRRLLDRPGVSVSTKPLRMLILIASLFGILVFAQFIATVVAMGAMGCGMHQM